MRQAEYDMEKKACLALAFKGFGKINQYPESDLSEFYFKLLDYDDSLEASGEITSSEHRIRRVNLYSKIDNLGNEMSSENPSGNRIPDGVVRVMKIIQRKLYTY